MDGLTHAKQLLNIAKFIVHSIFLNRDIKQIHGMIQKVTSSDPKFSIDKLNQSLAIQLETLLTNKGSINHEDKDNNKPGTAIYDIQCIKGKRNCKNRSIIRLFAYCKGGNFNIHIWAWFGYFIC